MKLVCTHFIIVNILLFQLKMSEEQSKATVPDPDLDSLLDGKFVNSYEFYLCIKKLTEKSL